jgi:RNA ligase (TIGR02306 family)
MEVTERKLASIQKIDEISPHINADNLEIAKILGYNVVVKKKEYRKGDTIIYCECDSIMPKRAEFEFL